MLSQGLGTVIHHFLDSFCLCGYVGLKKCRKKLKIDQKTYHVSRITTSMNLYFLLIYNLMFVCGGVGGGGDCSVHQSVFFPKKIAAKPF